MRVLVLEPDDYMGLSVLRSLGSARYIQCAALFRGRRQIAAYSRYCKQVYETNGQSGEEVFVERVISAIKHYSADVLLAVNSTATKFLIRHRDTLSQYAACAAVPTRENYAYAEDKGLLARAMEAESIPYPKTWHPRDADFEESLRRAEGPFLTKPVDGVFGLGIEAHDTAQEALNRLRRQEATERRFIVQQYLVGEDFDCSVYCENGVVMAHTMQTPLSKSGRFGSGSDLQMVHSPEVLEIIKRLVRVVGWNGVAHIDLLRAKGSGRHYVLELNGRFWGSLIASTAAGVNFPEIACRRALGLSIRECEQRTMKFHAVGLGLQDFLFRMLNSSKSKFELRETQLPYFCKDPFPDLYMHASRVLAK